MRKLLLTLAIISMCLYTLFSCQPDEVPETPPGWDWRIDRSAWPPSGGYWVRSTSASPDLCPNHGDNCYKRPPKIETFIKARDLFVTFKSYYDAQNIGDFFRNSTNWNQLFPKLNINSDTIQNIINGVYKTHITPDSNIVIYTGELANPNFILAVVPNLNVPQQE